MEDVHHSVRGEQIVKSLINDYHSLLEALGEKGAIRESKERDGQSTQASTKLESQVQMILQRMRDELPQLRLMYSLCVEDLGASSLPDNLFDVPLMANQATNRTVAGAGGLTNNIQAERDRLVHVLEEKNAQLKMLIDELRNILWYSDVLSCDVD